MKQGLVAAEADDEPTDFIGWVSYTLGDSCTRAIQEVWGGRQLYIAEKAADHQALCKVVGLADAQTICLMWGGASVVVPLGPATLMATQALIALAGTAASIAGVGWAALRAVPLIASLIPEITGLTSAMAAMDLAMDANPIGVIALALGVLGGAIGLVILRWDTIVKGIEDGCSQIENSFHALDMHLPPWLRKALAAGGAILSFEFPALGAATLLTGALAHAPRPDAKPTGDHRGAGAPKGPATTHAPAARTSHPRAVTPASFDRPLDVRSPWMPQTWPASFDRPPTARASSNSAGSSNRSGSERQVLGTIIVKADQGTSIQRISSSSDLELQYHRGMFPG